MKLGSLFDGSGGFPLAGVINGIEPVWASEIEPFPIRVTKLRFPTMKHLGSVTDINGAEIEQVDIITFGSPCQDLSVAGKQAGIHDGERSSLFFEAVRIIKEMRNHDRATGRADHDVRPRFAVWENVPGAFSSNKGADFGAVLQAFCDIEGEGVPVPQPQKWTPAGCIVGDGFSLAWRVYDAQFWGVPQRRKRIYLIADFGSERAGEILFEREGLHGHPAQGREAGEGTAEDAEGSVGGSGNVAYSIEGHIVDRQTTQNGRGWAEGYAHTLNATDRHAVVYDARGNGYGAVVPTITGDHENRVTDYTALAVCVGNGQLHQTDLGDKAGALNCMHDQQAVIYPGVSITNKHNRSNPKWGDPAPSVTTDSRNYLVTKTPRKYIVRRLTPIECARLQGFPDWWCEGADGSDSAQYKLWGNGIALPCAVDVLGRIVKEANRCD